MQKGKNDDDDDDDDDDEIKNTRAKKKKMMKRNNDKNDGRFRSKTYRKASSRTCFPSSPRSPWSTACSARNRCIELR